MKLSTITTILFSGVALTIAAEVGAPLKARQAQAQACSFTGFKGTGFTGNSQPFSGDVCTPLSASFKTDYQSVKPPAGCVCYFSSQGSCGDCAACIDDSGFTDLSSLPNVGSFRCETAGSGGCNANCPK